MTLCRFRYLVLTLPRSRVTFPVLDSLQALMWLDTVACLPVLRRNLPVNDLPGRLPGFFFVWSC